MNERAEAVKAYANSRIGCPYVYGGTGKTCTPDYRRDRMDQYPKYADLIRNNCPRLKSGAGSCAGCKWAENGKGRQAYDCAQLMLYAMMQAKITLVSGANSQWLRTEFVIKGPIAEMPRDMMCLVYREDSDGKKHHTGLYEGDGSVTHAKGHDYGVVREPLEAVKLTHYAIPSGLYTAAELRAAGIEPGLNLPTLRRGSRGKLVEQLQKVLNFLLDGKLAVDGIFGEKTEKAVKAFQKAAGLAQDGVVGPKTWGALGAKEADEPAETPEAPEAPADSTTDPPTEQGEEIAKIPKSILKAWAEELEDLARSIRKYADC
jgi:hypothetical protein